MHAPSASNDPRACEPTSKTLNLLISDRPGRLQIKIFKLGSLSGES